MVIPGTKVSGQFRHKHSFLTSALLTFNRAEPHELKVSLGKAFKKPPTGLIRSLKTGADE